MDTQSAFDFVDAEGDTMENQDRRAELDAIDDEILRLFRARMDIAPQADSDAQTERDALYRVCSSCDESLQNYAKILFSTLFDVSRTHRSALVKRASPVVDEIRGADRKDAFPLAAQVACQGIEGAYSQIAAERIFSIPQIMYMNTFDGVFNAVDKGLCKYGVLPIENSTAGSVTAVYELMKKYKFSIARSVKLRISHTLLAKSGVAMGDIKEIYSHEQAINQCADFLQRNPRIKVTVCENTAVAAKMAAESDRTDVAALSSKNCASIYGLNVLSSDVQNSDNNYTRFICISKGLEIYKGANKISLMLTLGNKAGALYSLLTKFSVLGLNLTKLESRPIRGTDFEFMFYFDIDGSTEDEKVLTLMGQLAETTDYFAFLGNYAEV
jgi:chorismate mutase/prephenate dehydratase